MFNLIIILLNMKRRKFLKSIGAGTAAFSVPWIGAACRAGKKKQQRPNILWIYVEDMSPLMSCYGYDLNPTPNLDKLSRDGVRFAHTFMPAPVCSPGFWPD